METQTQTDIEAAVFRRLVSHLDSRKDVQNIDLCDEIDKLHFQDATVKQTMKELVT